MPRQQKKYHFIYKTTNLLSGKYYIGMHSTNDINDGYIGSGKRLRYSINKYGKENHKREILEFCKNRKELISREKDIVDLNEIAKEECINLRIGGSGVRKNYGVTEETRKKLSENNGRYWKYNEIPADMRLKISDTLKGHSVSNITRDKISKSKKGQSIGSPSDETKQKLSIAHKGKKLSDETKQKLSIAHKGKKLSDETKQKIGNSSRGIPRTPETKEKISKSHQGKVMSLEFRKKLSLINKGKHQKKVIQKTKDGNTIKIWESITSAAEKLKINQSHISNCCNGRRKTTGGYMWAFLNE